jgi:hypothetical protein
VRQRWLKHLPSLDALARLPGDSAGWLVAYDGRQPHIGNVRAAEPTTKVGPKRWDIRRELGRLVAANPENRRKIKPAVVLTELPSGLGDPVKKLEMRRKYHRFAPVVCCRFAWRNFSVAQERALPCVTERVRVGFSWRASDWLDA